jgi:TonB family protein
LLTPEETFDKTDGYEESKMLAYVFLLLAATPEPSETQREKSVESIQSRCSSEKSPSGAAGCNEPLPIEYKPEPQPIIYIPAPDRRRAAKPRTNPGNWASLIDFPARALKDRRQGIVAFQLEITPDGRVSHCNITGSSGHPDLDSTTCVLMARRGRFDPALDGQGQPIPGKWSNRVKWSLPSEAFLITRGKVPQLANGHSTQLEKSDYPAEAMSAKVSGDTIIKLSVTASGEVADCVVEKSSKSDLLDNQSCSIARNWRFNVLRDDRMRPVGSKIQYRFSWLAPL